MILFHPKGGKDLFFFFQFIFQGQHILGFSENRISIMENPLSIVGSWLLSQGLRYLVKFLASWLRRPAAGEFLWDFHVPKQSVENGPPEATEAIGVIHSLKRTANIAPENRQFPIGKLIFQRSDFRG